MNGSGVSCGRLWPAPGTISRRHGPVKPRRLASSRGGRVHPVVGAVQHHARHRDRRLRRKLRLDAVERRVAFGIAEAVPVGVHDHIDEVRIVERAGGTLESRVIERPARRPEPPEAAGTTPAGSAPAPPGRGGRENSIDTSSGVPTPGPSAVPTRRCPGCCSRSTLTKPCDPFRPQRRHDARRPAAPIIARQQRPARCPARPSAPSKSAPSAACWPERGVSGRRNRVGP